MKDVAERAGVSAKTVSNVINGYRYLAPETRARVEAAIDELGYRMNVSARSLRSGRSGIISLVVPELRVAYFAELAQAFMDEAEKRGLSVLVSSTNGVRARELAALGEAHGRFADGVIIHPTALSEVDLSPDLTLPVVVLGDHVASPPIDHVAIANEAAARTAIEHLCAVGSTRIALIGTGSTARSRVGAARLVGSLEGAKVAGVVIPPERMIDARLWHREGGEAAVGELLSKGEAFDGLFCFNDELAFGALHALRAHGISVPDDVAVVGFDDSEEARYSSPALTSIAPDTGEIASSALDLLAGRWGGQVPADANKVLARFRLVVRESTGDPANTVLHR